MPAPARILRYDEGSPQQDSAECPKCNTENEITEKCTDRLRRELPEIDRQHRQVSKPYRTHPPKSADTPNSGHRTFILSLLAD